MKANIVIVFTTGRSQRKTGRNAPPSRCTAPAAAPRGSASLVSYIYNVPIRIRGTAITLIELCIRISLPQHVAHMGPPETCARAHIRCTRHMCIRPLFVVNAYIWLSSFESFEHTGGGTVRFPATFRARPRPPRPAGGGGLCSLQGPYDRSATFFGRYDRCWPKAGPKALAVTEQPAAARVKSGL